MAVTDIKQELEKIFLEDTDIKKVFIQEVSQDFMKTCLTRTDNVIQGYWVNWYYNNNIATVYYCKKG